MGPEIILSAFPPSAMLNFRTLTLVKLSNHEKQTFPTDTLVVVTLRLLLNFILAAVTGTRAFPSLIFPVSDFTCRIVEFFFPSFCLQSTIHATRSFIRHTISANLAGAAFNGKACSIYRTTCYSFFPMNKNLVLSNLCLVCHLAILFLIVFVGFYERGCNKQVLYSQISRNQSLRRLIEMKMKTVIKFKIKN